MRPQASLSVDLDNTWAYLRTAGIPEWSDYPSCLDVVVPRILATLGEQRLAMTIFVVGKDASLSCHRNLLEAVSAAGHEVGNHSFHHEAWLHLYSDGEIADEVARSEDAIEEATGQRPLGFRGPGYSLSGSTLQVLVDRGYRYDASTLPTYIGPLARAWYFRTSRLEPEERARLGALFGGFRDGLRPNRPYRFAIGDAELLEIPVTTMPFLRVPIHLSYVLWLASFSMALARRYFAVALGLCQVTACSPSILLHSLDFADRTDVPELSFFPGMSLSRHAKSELMTWCLARLVERFDVLTIGEQAARMGHQPLGPPVNPSFGPRPPRRSPSRR